MPAQTNDRPTLVLVHGFPLDSRIWSAQRAALADQFRVITPELPGFGQSKSDGQPFTLEQLADDLHATLASQNATPAIIGGLSMGGYVLLEYVKKHPQDLRGLMLIDTKAEADTPEGKEGRNKMAQLARERGAAAVAEQMMPKMVAPDAAQHRPAVVRELRAIMESQSPKTIEHALLAMRDRRDHVANLAAIKVPTLVIVGDQDALIPVATAEKTAKAIQNAQLCVIKGAGHMTPMEQPEQTTRAIRDFVSKLSP